MKASILVICISVLLFSWSGCKKEDSNSTGPTPTGEVVNTTLSGRILDEQGNPVSGATVTAGGLSASSNQWGIYLIENVSLSKTRAVITVSKPGFWSQTGACHPSKGTVTYLNLTLFNNTTTLTLSSSSGGTVTLSSGATVEFPANAFATSSGSAYTGTVNICMHELAANDPKLGLKIPGSDLIAVGQNGEDGLLKTYGMIGVKMTDQNGNELQLISGKKAKLTFPVVSTQSASAPANIDLWYFDELAGKWEKEGSAVKTGSTYKGEVAHFTWWNCDVWVPLAYASGYVKDCNGNLLANAEVMTFGLNGGGSSYGSSDANGYYFGGIASGEDVQIQAQDQSTGDLSQIEIVNTPVNTIVNVSDLIINPPNCYSVITGTTVSCNNNAVSSTVICFDSLNTFINYLYTSNGTFSISVPQGTYKIIAYSNLLNGTTSAFVPTYGQTISVGNLPLCDSINQNNNLQLTFVSTTVGTINTSIQVSSCHVENLGNYQAIAFDDYNSNTGTVTSIGLSLTNYTTGIFPWSNSFNTISGYVYINNQYYQIYSDPNGTGSTTIYNAPPSGGIIGGNFNGDVILYSMLGPSVSGTLTSNFSIYRNY